MSRVSLEVYYKSFFNKESAGKLESFVAINRAHVLSSEFYDVQFGRSSLVYRDNHFNLVIPVDHDIKNTLIVYFNSFLSNNLRKPSENLLMARLRNSLNFLKVEYEIL